MSDECWSQWGTLLNQCWNEHDEEHPYSWTEDCDMVMQNLRQHFDPGELAVNLSRISNKKRPTMNPKITAKSINAMNLAKVSANGSLREASSGKEFSSGIAVGAGVGAVGILAAFIAIRACQQNKKGKAENLERLLQ